MYTYMDVLSEINLIIVLTTILFPLQSGHAWFKTTFTVDGLTLLLLTKYLICSRKYFHISVCIYYGLKCATCYFV